MSLIFLASVQTALAQEPAKAPTPPPSGLIANGYLKISDLPDSAVLVPPPPAPGSVAKKRDEEAAAAAVAQRGSARWTLAIADAELMAPDAIGQTFSCAAGFDISAKTTPALAALLQRSLANIAVSTMAAKRRYQRARPFMENGQPSCTPAMEPILRKDGSYPSGHSAIGFGTGLILTQVVPSRATELIARGRAFGDSRRICNVHWTSDIEEGRFMAAATVARLNADPVFQKDLAIARKEVDSVIEQRTGPRRDCAAEASALSATR
ncbi:MAG TPA: phosphatase PAP2 family protein [Sphingobium sp.]|uniref:acid phosphatase n=1 Tax=Sphingobium sp. TaxID=1912891 RepID=UPI002ED02FF2